MTLLPLKVPAKQQKKSTVGAHRVRERGSLRPCPRIHAHYTLINNLLIFTCCSRTRCAPTVVIYNCVIGYSAYPDLRLIS